MGAPQLAGCSVWRPARPGGGSPGISSGLFRRVHRVERGFRRTVVSTVRSIWILATIPVFWICFSLGLDGSAAGVTKRNKIPHLLDTRQTCRDVQTLIHLQATTSAADLSQSRLFEVAFSHLMGFINFQWFS